MQAVKPLQMNRNRCMYVIDFGFHFAEKLISLIVNSISIFHLWPVTVLHLRRKGA